jgi:hypothetical protein
MQSIKAMNSKPLMHSASTGLNADVSGVGSILVRTDPVTMPNGSPDATPKNQILVQPMVAAELATGAAAGNAGPVSTAAMSEVPGTMPVAPVAGAPVVAIPGSAVAGAPGVAGPGTPVAGAPGAPVAAVPMTAAPVAEDADSGISWLYVIALLLFCGFGIFIGISMSLFAGWPSQMRMRLQNQHDSEEHDGTSSSSWALVRKHSEFQRSSGKKLSGNFTRTNMHRHILQGHSVQFEKLPGHESDLTQDDGHDKNENKGSGPADTSRAPRRSLAQIKMNKGRSDVQTEDPPEEAPEAVASDDKKDRIQDF